MVDNSVDHQTFVSFQDGQALFKRTYAVSNDRTILVSPLEPGKTYITVLVAGDGIRAETRSDPQRVTTLGKGTSFIDDHAHGHILLTYKIWVFELTKW